MKRKDALLPLGALGQRMAIMVLLMLSLSLQGQASGKDGAKPKKGFRLLYWNIQNGMWCGQDDNYTSFVKWVKEQRPDVCVWCEAQTIYYSGTAKAMKKEERYLPDHWAELARRYGHKYWYIGGYRDNYPQVITSRYPIENVERITGNADTTVMHGAGWATIEVRKQKINIVTLHTWPQAYAPNAKDRELSKQRNEGSQYRKKEVEYIYRHTLGKQPGREQEYWMMMGDFNSRSPLDNKVYNYTLDSPNFWVHHYILGNTPYIDAVAHQHPGEFFSSTGSNSRIDFVYCTPSLYECVTRAEIITDDYTRPRRDEQKLSNFWHPSDHLPILVDFELK